MNLEQYAKNRPGVSCITHCFVHDGGVCYHHATAAVTLLALHLRQTVPFENATVKCFRRLSVSEEVQRMIQSCMVSQIGAKLQQEAAEKTANTWPDKHTFVPWVIVNGISLKSKQTMINNLPYLLCEWYIGDNKIPFCRSEKRKRMFKIWLEKILFIAVIANSSIVD
ncbi:hypothetical protein KIN20_031695 [Parelaphostrongylus tenuis]|uniref:Uncharacterized protein n=1 Tax=Parelaphostrongylus tenuis TaxID=148309 RepID=A0AAD5WH72_PARTN|nr:hypothetical protein KIN20_031695 [Parelaphostrongylus tenuis]